MIASGVFITSLVGETYRAVAHTSTFFYLSLGLLSSSGSLAIFAAIRRAYVIQPSRFARVNSYCTIVWMRHSIK